MRNSRLYILALACALVVPLAWSESPAGRWRLVEQNYGDGAGNTIDPDNPHWLELVEGPAGWSGSMQVGSTRAERWDWPSVITEGRQRELQQVAIRSVAAEETVEVSYRVPPSPGDDLTLLISERYRLGGDDELVGVVQVRFERDGEVRGGYTLHRRYERVR